MGKISKFSNSAKPALSAVKEDALLETRTELVADPVDVRLTLDGAIVKKDGKIDVAAYEDLHTWFAGEPSPDKHPIRATPGVHLREDIPKGMRVWDDLRAGAKTGKDGAGWIAARVRKGEPKKEKWFNIRTCGSWRLAFLLARLQWNLWEYRGATGPKGIPAASASAVSAAATSANTTGAGGPSDQKVVVATTAVNAGSAGEVAAASTDAVAEAGKSTPQKKRPRQEGTPSARKQPRQEKKVEASSQQRSPAQSEKSPAVSVNVLSGSVRLQQILAARRAKEEQEQQAQAKA